MTGLTTSVHSTSVDIGPVRIPKLNTGTYHRNIHEKKQKQRKNTKKPDTLNTPKLFW